MAHKYDNTVILSQGGEHGTRVIQWWKEQGVNKTGYNGNDRDLYYGLINGIFDVYDLEEINKANAKIIELPVAYLSSTDWKAFARDINKQDLIGRKVRGFKFEDGNGVILDEEMKSFISQLGHITEQFKEYVVIKIHKKFMANPISLIHEHLVDVDTSKQNVDTSPQIIDLTNVDGVEMMVSDDGKRWFKEIVIAKCAGIFIDCNCSTWKFAKPIEVKKVTMQEIEEAFGCKVEIVKEVSNEQ